MRAFAAVVLLALVLFATTAHTEAARGSESSSGSNSKEITESLKALAIRLINYLVALPLRLLSRAVFAWLELPYYAVRGLWSWIEPGSESALGLTKAGTRMLSGGLLAGVASRIFETDFIEHGLKALRVDKVCTRMAACELGAYILHSNKALVPLLSSVAERLFKSTSKYWEPMRQGLHGALCHHEYTSCDKEFLMKR